MADAATIAVLIQAKDNASREFKNVENNMGKMVQGIQKHRRAIGMAMTAMGAAITGIAVMSVKSAFDQEKGIRQLDTALQKVGTSYEQQKAQIEAVVAAQQNKTNFGDEEQRDALRELILVSGNYDDAMKALVPTMELAAGKEMDLGAAATLVARAISGEESALNRYGVSVEKGADSTEVLSAIMAKFQGQAEAAADPVTQLKNRAGDLFQVFGSALLPVIETLVPLIEKMVRRMIEWTEAHPNLTKVLGVVVAALGAIMLVLGPLLLILPTLVAGIGLVSAAFAALSISMGPVTLAIIGIAALITAAIIVWKKWDDMSTKVKIAVVLLGIALGPITGIIVLGIAAWKNWDRIVDIVRKTIGTFTRQVIGFIIKLGEGFLAITKWIPGMSDTRRAIEETMGTLRNAQDSVDDWANNTEGKLRDQSEAWGAMEDTQMQAAQAMIENNDDLGRKTAEVADKVGEKTREVGRTTQEVAEDMAQAYGDMEDAAFQAQGGIIRSLDEIQKEQDRFTALQQLSLESRISQREKDRQDFIDGVNETIAASQRRRDAEARIEEASDRGLARLRDNLDITNIAWKDSGSKMEDVVQAWSAITGDSIKDVLARMDDLNVDTNNVKSTLQTFTSETGKDFLAWSETVKGAAQKAADELKSNAERIREGGWLTLEQEKFLAEKGVGPLAEAARESLASKADTKKTQLEEAVEKGLDPDSIASAQRLVQHHVAGAKRMGVPTPADEMAKKMADQVREDILTINPQLAAALGAIVAGEIPWKMELAKGGIVTQPTLAMIGEAGPEAVIPLGKGGGMGTVNNFHFHGSVYGVEDLKEAVVEAVRDHAISGGFAGVFAEA